MTARWLAVPFGSLLILAAVSSRPVSAQTNQDPAPSAAPAATQAPGDNLSLEETARLYLVRKQFHEAEEIFRQLTREQPRNAVYWNELGISLHNQAQLNQAMKCYEKSAKLDGKYADALNNMGTVWYERKKYGKAIRSYKKAIALRGDFAPFYLNLGYAYFSKVEYEDSIASFRKALAIDPNVFDSSRSRMGTVVQDRSLNGDRGRFYFLLAKSFAESGNVERCFIYLKKARDEGYADFNAAKSDPSFAAAMKDPAVQELFVTKQGEAAQP